MEEPGNTLRVYTAARPRHLMRYRLKAEVPTYFAREIVKA